LYLKTLQVFLGALRRRLTRCRKQSWTISEWGAAARIFLLSLDWARLAQHRVRRSEAFGAP
jgi:hypothetical protein